MWNIPSHTFRHFHEILILNCVSVLIYTRFDKKHLTFHQKTATRSKMMWNMKCEKACSVKCARHTLHTFLFLYFVVVSWHFIVCSPHNRQVWNFSLLYIYFHFKYTTSDNISVTCKNGCDGISFTIHSYLVLNHTMQFFSRDKIAPFMTSNTKFNGSHHTIFPHNFHTIKIQAT